jgi:ribosomal protein S17
MIDRQNGKLVVECDSCDAVLETDTADFAECREVMKREEWKVRKIASEWLHGCHKCGVPT